MESLTIALSMAIRVVAARLADLQSFERPSRPFVSQICEVDDAVLDSGPSRYPRRVSLRAALMLAGS